ncbi:hypothetical protein BACI348_10033 [Bacillus altitudinis]|uniref:Uncharacterized protein n=1 Tax=Bacillus altitudinis TaxID=293387 RepID=A0A653LEK0_BACAB|nr:hypothetical protein BACI348_10033 [Bacillus altitudinis]
MIFHPISESSLSYNSIYPYFHLILIIKTLIQGKSRGSHTFYL